MKIISIRRDFQPDHSSTSYEFLAVDRRLTREERQMVKGLSSRVNPTDRRAHFIYHGDWSDLPGGWEKLMQKYYDVMYSESYDWWTLAFAINAKPEFIKKIEKYDFSGIDDLGVSVESKDKRVIITIHCQMDSGELADFDEYSDFAYNDDDEDDEDNDSENDINEPGKFESGDSLLNLLMQNREYLKKGDLRLLYGVWQKYSYEDEEDEEDNEDAPPATPGMDKLPKPISELLSLLTHN